jgi:hypothetical protein
MNAVSGLNISPQKLVTTWLALHNRLNTIDRLASRGIISDANCPFGCPTEETLAHFLYQCPHTSFLWNRMQVIDMQGLHNVQGATTHLRLAPAQRRQDWATIFIAGASNIWLARNRSLRQCNYPRKEVGRRMLGYNNTLGKQVQNNRPARSYQ